MGESGLLLLLLLVVVVVTVDEFRLGELFCHLLEIEGEFVFCKRSDTFIVRMKRKGKGRKEGRLERAIHLRLSLL